MRELRAEYQHRLLHFEQSPERAEDYRHPAASLPDEIELLLITAERERINQLYRQGALKDEARRRLERELDLHETTVSNHQHEE